MPLSAKGSQPNARGSFPRATCPQENALFSFFCPNQGVNCGIIKAETIGRDGGAAWDEKF
ncbi:hypothetical protein A5N86_06455 [Geobacillus thermoleovorans]|uniref:Uncharacterized protein n=2 Tax=Geobacillus thermoleovorans group TaxID=1505648 RepID=A0A2Z3N8D4_GEOTH|nr:hypothetical protein GT3570_13395 [Geobacillus thermoleovorans]AUI37560.1 hypothetical protein CWI35_14540 [[Bacillus] caldolyticus]EQB95612.1 hypothetical protein GA8_10790 [Geobacillus sp. A8]KDE47218.1 hypothetical protein DI44_13840 [Geobacillus sp. CAMR5420]AWO75142.1 hypothetical protein C1N76_11965 [Geobacillus thermoleovorans]